jgi:hypothetical protein
MPAVLGDGTLGREVAESSARDPFEPQKPAAELLLPTAE